MDSIKVLWAKHYAKVLAFVAVVTLITFLYYSRTESMENVQLMQDIYGPTEANTTFTNQPMPVLPVEFPANLAPAQGNAFDSIVMPNDAEDDMGGIMPPQPVEQLINSNYLSPSDTVVGVATHIQGKIPNLQLRDYIAVPRTLETPFNNSTVPERDYGKFPTNVWQ